MTGLPETPEALRAMVEAAIGPEPDLQASFRKAKALNDLQDAAPAAFLALADALEREARLRETLAWYGEQARLARLIHSEGDAGRHALQADGGKRARAALAPKTETAP